jgi:heat-inducible transcriptional repressor
MQLSPRQTQILKIIVEEYIDTAQPVGSEMLDRKYNLGISPATIRNEMVQLVAAGYLKQPHVSAGRTPTPLGLKYYVNELLKEQDLSVAEEVSVKERMWDVRNQTDDLLREATRALAERTNCIGVAVTDQAKAYHAGYLHLLDEPEFYDIDVTKTVFQLLDESKELLAIFDQASDEEPIHVLLGDDFDNQFLQPVGIVFADFTLGPTHGSIGVIGPARLKFSYVIPLIRHLSRTIQEITADFY